MQGLFADLPLLALIPLVVLGGGFEAVWGLHVGVERIGRFIQVTYESAQDGASWETTAMRASPGLPGGGADPLFTVVFAAATLVNLGVAFVAQPTPIEVVLLFGCHAALLLRLGTGADRCGASAPRRSRRVDRGAPGRATVSAAAGPVRRDFAGNQELLTKRGAQGGGPSR